MPSEAEGCDKNIWPLESCVCWKTIVEQSLQVYKCCVYICEQHHRQLVFDVNYLVHHMYYPNYTVIFTEPQDNDVCSLSQGRQLPL